MGAGTRCLAARTAQLGWAPAGAAGLKSGWAAASGRRAQPVPGARSDSTSASQFSASWYRTGLFSTV
jgi:hypothetical protein